ncbi:MAG: cadherin-like beta sandwich domain-containing protein [Bacilli bacterium]|nr:cadherin-like beta sandwich domain-containing protein [Bacilli bacterium]
MKKYLLILIISFLLISPKITNAASANVTLSCPSSANSGATISCTVSVSTDTLINGIAANYTLNNLTYVSFTPSSGFSTNYSSASGFSIGNTNGKKGTYTVGTIKVKVNGAASLTIRNLDLSDKSYNSYSPASKTASIRLNSTNNNLSSLSLSNGALSPAFNASTTNYTSTINAANVTIKATTSDSKAKISGAGTKTLNYGANTFNIVVTSESGSKKTYKIVITRPDSRSNNNNLKSLSTDKATISFNKNTTTYNLNVDSNVNSIKINATLEDSKSSFVSGFGPRTVNLNYGNNKIEIKVKAENTNIKTYTINVNRKDNRSSNNYLKEITLDKGNILFNKNTLEYSTTVYYDVTKINVVATTEDSKATVTINSPNLLVGNNLITIVVKAENGATRTYKITVIRYDENVKMSDNNNISTLKVLGHEIDFKPDVLEYDLTIKDEYALVFEVSLEDPKSNYTIEGNKELKDGSIIKVISKSESGLDKEYKFNIHKEKVKEDKNDNNNQNNHNIFIYTIIGFISGILITIIVTKIINKKNNNKLNKTKIDLKN